MAAVTVLVMLAAVVSSELVQAAVPAASGDHAGSLYHYDPSNYANEPWHDPALRDDPMARAEALLGKMTDTEIFAMVHGSTGPYVGNVVPNKRLGIPALNLNDGPQGFRYNAGPGTSTQWPSGLTVSTTWDLGLIEQWGAAMGEEFAGKGANVQLGPGLCVARVPLNGRNFEYSSGEDPYLGAQAVVPLIKGIQSKGVVATAKHYIMNNQETNRNSVSENVDERTRHEIYLPPFAAAAAAGSGAVMCSYNKINDTYACENEETLNVELKNQSNFQGWVMSDWGATHSATNAANAGLDQEMPSDNFFGSTLQKAVASGAVDMATVKDKVLRQLWAMFSVGIFDTPQPTGPIGANVTSVEHNTLARTIAAAATVLLKNDDGLLPLNASKKQTIAVIGEPADVDVITGGGGSGSVVPYYQVTPLSGISERAAKGAPQTCVTVEDTDFFQPGNPSAPATSVDDCCTQCYNRAGCNAFTFLEGTCWFKPNDAGRRPRTGATSGTCSRPPTSVDEPTDAGVLTGGGGSGSVVPDDQVAPPNGLSERAAKGAAAQCSTVENTDFFQPGNPSAPATSADDCCTQCYNRAGCNAFTFLEGTCWFKPDQSGRRPRTGATSGTCVRPWTTVTYDTGTNVTSAALTAAAADIAVVVIATTSSEGHDRSNLSVVPEQLAYLNAVADAQPNTVVVMITPGALLTPFADKVKAIVSMHMPGQEEGHALADVLFGDVNPSGRLALSYPNKENEVGFTQEQYPGVPASDPAEATYSEQLEIGYRWYTSHNVKPAFAFGHGLSYTNFAYSDIVVAGRNVTVTVKNTGSIAGAEVAQLYVAFPAVAGEPPMQLRGFRKATIAAGGSTQVSFSLSDRDLSVWDVASKSWVIPPGTFGVMVGASSADIRLKATLTP